MSPPFAAGTFWGIWMTQSQEQKRSLLKPDDMVKTPTGRTALILELHPKEQEATIQWLDGDRARFKLKLLRVV